jgi:hypothetical protein
LKTIRRRRRRRRRGKKKKEKKRREAIFFYVYENLNFLFHFFICILYLKAEIKTFPMPTVVHLHYSSALTIFIQYRRVKLVAVLFTAYSAISIVLTVQLYSSANKVG